MENLDPQCSGKAKYPTKGAALRRIDAQMGRVRAKHRDMWGKRCLQAYRCPRCCSWHVGGSGTVGAKRDRMRNEFDDGLLGMLPAGLLRKIGRA